MLKLNPFYRFDQTGLVNYLRAQATKGNHIKYVSPLFLIFKKGIPTNDYFMAIPYGKKDKSINGQRIRSSADYLIYKADTPLIYEQKDFQLEWFNPFLIFFGVIVMLYAYNFSSYRFIWSDSETLLRKIFMTLLIISMIYTLVYKKYKTNKMKASQELLLKNKWDYCVFVLSSIIILLCLIIVYGLYSSALLYAVTFMLFAYIVLSFNINTILAFTVMFSLPFAQVNYNEPSIETYFHFTPEIRIFEKDQTIFAQYDWYVASSGDLDIHYQYYRVANDWLLKELNAYFEKELKINDYARPIETLEIEEFDEVYKQTFDYQNHSSYYFRSGNQVIQMRVDPVSEKYVVDFVKAKMKLGE